MAAPTDPHPVEVRKAAEMQQNDYEVIKPLIDNVYLIQRKSDRAQFLGQPHNIDVDQPSLWALMERSDTAVSTAAVLNHENLVSIVHHLAEVTFSGAGGSMTNMLLTDFCDGGNLKTLLRYPPVAARKCPRSGETRGFLPENICWHVLISILRALAWLHEGYRHVEHMGLTDDAGKYEWYTEEYIIDEDWMPILHRDVRAENIFLQQPRGTETFGFCKLGNFSKIFVSGHRNGRSGGPAASIKEGFESMENLRKTMAKDSIYDVAQDKRPYTKGTDLFGLGIVLYRMMADDILPNPEECNLHQDPDNGVNCWCRHWDSTTPACPHPACHKDVDRNAICGQLTDYTGGLRGVLNDLLAHYRGNGVLPSAVDLLKQALAGYKTWKQGTPDGALYRDYYDDMNGRYKNLVDKEDRDIEQATAQQGSRTRVGVGM